MSDQTLVSTVPDFENIYSEFVKKDERQGYEGFIVEASSLLVFAKNIRDEWGYDLLSSVTAVDYFPENMEVVYHLYRSLGGGSLVFKVQISREDSKIEFSLFCLSRLRISRT